MICICVSITELCILRGRAGNVPVKERPKTSSFGGNNVFGVLLCVILSCEGSRFLIFVAEAASALTLYVFEAPHVACAILVECLLNALARRNWRSIVAA